METYFGTFQLTRLIFQRGLAAIYLIAFIAALNQFPALLGQHGLLPASDFIKSVPFKESPSIFYLGYTDRIFRIAAAAGIVLSITALLGISERGSWALSFGTWIALWILYQSIVNVGQRFYAFGWESMLLEAGFFCAFLGPAKLTVSSIPVIILRWMLFRVEFGAGLIKLRADPCWRDFSCLFYHFQTQPLPNPLSWYFYYLPKPILRFGVLFSHFAQMIVPFGLFGPQKVAAISGGIIIFHQLMLIISGNYSWLNWLTVILAIMAISDDAFGFIGLAPKQGVLPRSTFYNVILYALAFLVLILSGPPAKNFFSRYQYMNYSYNPLHLVDSYGAFGSITKKRYEIIIEGTGDSVITPQTQWSVYEFKAKPGALDRRPPQIAPYHLRIDWLMWFLPFSTSAGEKGILVPEYQTWFLSFIVKLLDGDKLTIKLLKYDPFPDHPPHFIRARYYLYEYTDARERRETGNWWKRTLVGEYLPPVEKGLKKAE